MYRCVDILSEIPSAAIREHEAQQLAFSELFVKYIMEGNLDDGATLLQQAEVVVARGKQDISGKHDIVELAEATESLALSAIRDGVLERNERLILELKSSRERCRMLEQQLAEMQAGIPHMHAT